MATYTLSRHLSMQQHFVHPHDQHYSDGDGNNYDPLSHAALTQFTQIYHPPRLQDPDQQSTQSTDEELSGSISPLTSTPKSVLYSRTAYIPAVLRPNEHVYRPRRPQSPATMNEASTANIENSSPVRTRPRSRSSALPRSRVLSWLCHPSTWTSPTKFDVIDADGTTHDGELDLAPFPRVTGMPKRSHWKPDHTTPMCDETTCTKSFTCFTRRHHCRRCGNIFCDAHSSHIIPLDQNADFNPRAVTLSRSCDYCSNQYLQWIRREIRQKQISQIKNIDEVSPHHYQSFDELLDGSSNTESNGKSGHGHDVTDLSSHRSNMCYDNGHNPYRVGQSCSLATYIPSTLV